MAEHPSDHHDDESSDDLAVGEHQLECMDILCSYQVPGLLERLRSICNLSNIEPVVVPGVEPGSVESWALGLVVADRFRSTLPLLV